METATRLSPSQAAKRVGISKMTVLRALEEGKISGLRDEKTNRWWIEPVELFRVFPNASTESVAEHEAPHDSVRSGTSAASTETEHSETRSASYVERLKAELDALQREAKTQREERERERRQLEETIEDYRHRLDKAEEKRDEAVTKLTAILTDQREPPRRSLFGLLKRASA